VVPWAWLAGYTHLPVSAKPLTTQRTGKLTLRGHRNIDHAWICNRMKFTLCKRHAMGYSAEVNL
jgi:hypothetical protein